ncbi:MAG: hypothetical protein KGS10_05670 [Chloroflexi bacterium]|nr:hypothetical protein [Chloroflexota bacterium]
MTDARWTDVIEAMRAAVAAEIRSATQACIRADGLQDRIRDLELALSLAEERAKGAYDRGVRDAIEITGAKIGDMPALVELQDRGPDV